MWEIVKSVIGGLLGGSVAAVALWKWLGDLMLGKIIERERAKYAKEIEALKAKYSQDIESYRARLDRSVFVTRAHFETEFEAYKNLFEGLAEVKFAILGTRPSMRLERQDETEEDKRKELAESLNLLVRAHNKTVNVVEHLNPFYPNDIYLKLNECLTAARGEILDIKTAGDTTFSLGWYQEGQKRCDAFLAAFNSVADAIRLRISTLSIIPY